MADAQYDTTINRENEQQRDADIKPEPMMDNPSLELKETSTTLILRCPRTLSLSSTKSRYTPSLHEKLFQIIAHLYLSDVSSSAERTASMLTSPLSDRWNEIAYIYQDGEPGPTIKGYLTMLYGLILDVIEQIPPEHPYTGRLVSLLHAIKNQPPPNRRARPDLDYDKFEEQWCAALWQDLPIFGATVRQDFETRGAWAKVDDDTLAAAEWYHLPFTSIGFARRNAFLAKITSAGVLNCIDYSIWLLRESLERQKGAADLNEVLPSAVMWILHTGDLIYHNAAAIGVDENWSDVGPLCRAPGGYSQQRWDHWRDLFHAYSTMPELDREVQRLAGLAFLKMRRIETYEGEPDPLKGTAGLPALVDNTSVNKTKYLTEEQLEQLEDITGLSGAKAVEYFAMGL